MSSAAAQIRAPLPPGPSLGFWAQLQRMRADFLGYLVECAQTHGDVVRLQLAPGVATTLINHPDLIREVLVDRAPLFLKSAQTQRMVGKFLGRGLVLNEGESHARQRRLIRPAFHAERLDGYATVMARYTQEAVAAWPAGAVVDVDAEMTRLALRIVARTLFDADAQDTTSAAGLAMRSFEQAVQARFLSIPLPDWMPTPSNLRERRSVVRIHEVIQELVAARRKEGAIPKSDLLQMLLDARDADTGEAMSDAQLLDEAVTLFFAGHETSAHQLSWTLYLLAQHRDIEEALRAEVRDVLRGATPTLESARRLVQLDRVLKEALRLYPPSWVFDRAPTEDLTLGGFLVPKGEAIYVSPFVTQRDARWWPEPERFDPSRWAESAEERFPFSYLPFGAGPRMCVGQAFAQLEARVIIATLLQAGVRLESASTEPVKLEPSATLRPKGGMPMRVLESATA